MVKLNKIYTRTGDDGTTGLATGTRVAKHDPRLTAYGVVDEVNACVGMARAELSGGESGLAAILERIQNDLFDLGADLATPEADRPLRIAPAQVERLEKEIDALNADLSPLRSFILPGGTRAAAALHLARTVCRRAERAMTELAASDEGAVKDPALAYINRLSDLLFVVSRTANGKGKGDVLWVPGGNR